MSSEHGGISTKNRYLIIIICKDRRGWLSVPKRVKDHFWDWGLSYEAPFVTIGWKLWEKTSKKTQKELDNHYIDRRGWLSLPKRAKNHLWDWGLSYEAPFVTIVWKLWEKTSQNSQKAPLDIILSLEIQCKFADTYVKRKTLSQRTKFFDFFVHKSTWNSTKSRFSRGQKFGS